MQAALISKESIPVITERFPELKDELQEHAGSYVITDLGDGKYPWHLVSKGAFDAMFETDRAIDKDPYYEFVDVRRIERMIG